MVVQCGDEVSNEKNLEIPVAVSSRRSSARIKKLKIQAEEKASRLRAPNDSPSPTVNKTKRSDNKRRKLDNPVENGQHPSQETSNGEAENNAADFKAVVKLAQDGILNHKSTSAMVTETLRIFNKHYLHYVQEEEKRCGRTETRKIGKGSKAKGLDVAEADAKRGSKRPDLKALTMMRMTNSILYPKKRFGSIPGIDVGHQFFSRAEMVALGFHSHWLNGIDFIGQGKKLDYGDYILPLAISIVMSGQYEDDLDKYEEIVYTGQGGNNLLGDKRQIKDQVMQLGNLGLKNCMEQGVPVRVVRGHKCANSYVGKVYTYDGLYKVNSYWAEKGVSGYTVYKFRLKRVAGQPPLTTNQVHYSRGPVPNSIGELQGLVCDDISGGQEDIPIPATNLVDHPPVAPTGFTYCKEMKFSKSIKLPPKAPGCSCKDMCTDPRVCACAKLNGSDFPYVLRDGGRLIEPKAVVFECNSNCGCGPDCVNRTSQRGIKYRFEVFRTPNKGWAVRSWDYIPSGAPICEYIGILTKTDETDSAAANSYIFDIDCLQTMKGLDGRERRLRDVSLPTSEKDEEKSIDNTPEFCIDAGLKGNIARFINHSCQPNLFVQCVLSTHHDVKLARVVLIAADNIPPLKELTYDYGYVLDSVVGPDGKTKKMACYCGATDCRKRLF